MLQVVVGGYIAGTARSVEKAEDVVIEYMEWVNASGKFDVGITVDGYVVVPYVFKQSGRVVYEGEARLEVTSPACPLGVSSSN
ncbi:hypothetical protein FAZ69_04000 [Trinickia terrae]|uniref:Uncharacterized protein n=1 Tax=Trinickia terrae TaxID=2571161 RepID=A0A4U1IDB2_9BURK|nr:hypothetical protein [Trinickia terrae]TKC91618.1 hypothetical protein FAZ69_04000 [Trinickia terrae]